MPINKKWLFPSSLKEAKESQKIMAQQVKVQDELKSLTSIAGMDVSNNLFDKEQMVFAATVVLSYPQCEIQETASAIEKQEFPYIPGLLGFREAPALVHAFQKIKHQPDVILIDGHGTSHPRGLGIASHIGLLLDIPTIGVAKSLLVGHPASPLPEEPFSQVPLLWNNQVIAMLLRTKKRANPLIISAGHKVSLETAVNIVKATLKGYRLPEPTRQAHISANAARISYKN